jgi:hypothetical protein
MNDIFVIIGDIDIFRSPFQIDGKDLVSDFKMGKMVQQIK